GQAGSRSQGVEAHDLADADSPNAGADGRGVTSHRLRLSHLPVPAQSSFPRYASGALSVTAAIRQIGAANVTRRPDNPGPAPDHVGPGTEGSGGLRAAVRSSTTPHPAANQPGVLPAAADRAGRDRSNRLS